MTCTLKALVQWGWVWDGKLQKKQVSCVPVIGLCWWKNVFNCFPTAEKYTDKKLILSFWSSILFKVWAGSFVNSIIFANIISTYCECPKLVQIFHLLNKALTALSGAIHCAMISLEDDAVADGGQKIVEVELVFVVAQILAMLLPRFHQSFSKPVM